MYGALTRGAGSYLQHPPAVGRAPEGGQILGATAGGLAKLHLTATVLLSLHISVSG